MIPLTLHKRCLAFGSCCLLGLFLSSCATPYRPLKGHYGYSDFEVGKDDYEVRFLGNANSTYERARDFALLRAAEITLKQQASSFTLLDVVNLSTARKYTSSPQYYQTASPYLSTGGNVVPSAPEFTRGMSDSYVMMIPGEERTFYRPGVRLKIKLSARTPAGAFYDPAKLTERLKRKYRLK